MSILSNFNFDFEIDPPEPENVAEVVAEIVDRIPAEIAGEIAAEIVAESNSVAIVEPVREVPNFDDDPAILAIQGLVIESERSVITAEEEYAAATAKQHELDEKIREAEKAMNLLKAEKARINSEVWDFRNALSAKRRTFTEKQAEVKQIRANLEAQYEMEILSDVLEDRARKYAWFNGLPNGLKVLDHQWDAMRFMATGKRIILGDEMGLGKSLSAIGTLDIAEAKRILLIAPADITGNFYDEISFWAGHRAAITIRGESKAIRKGMLDAIQMIGEFIVIVNYEAWRKDHSLIEQLIGMGFDTVICDESHTLKGTNTNAYRGVAEICHATNKCPNDGTIRNPGVACMVCGWSGQSYDYGDLPWAEGYWLCRSVERIFMMTGSVILNKPEDLFSPLSILDPVNFPKDGKQSFLRTYAEWDYARQVYGFAAGGMDRLKRRLSGKFLARKTVDAGIILPPQKPIVHHVSLDDYPKQAMVIEQIAEQAEIALDDENRADIFTVIETILRQRQANVWPGGIVLKVKDPITREVIKELHVGEGVTESVKMDKAVDLIKELTATGARVVVFSQFSTALNELHARINGIPNDMGDHVRSVVFDGSTPQDVRTQIRTNFDRKQGEVSKWDVVLANYKTGGTGLNLTAATHTIILDREWNPGKENQALARTNRIGQTETTFVHVIEIPDTIDEWMNELISTKARMIDGFNEGADDLREQLLQKLRNRKKK